MGEFVIQIYDSEFVPPAWEVAERTRRVVFTKKPEEVRRVFSGEWVSAVTIGSARVYLVLDANPEDPQIVEDWHIRDGVANIVGSSRMPEFDAMLKKNSIVGHRMDIYKHRGSDCSNGGISSRFDEVVLVDGFDRQAPDCAVYIVDSTLANKPHLRAYPANKGKSGMFGGCFVYTSNGVVPHAGTPIPLHDRYD